MKDKLANDKSWEWAVSRFGPELDGAHQDVVKATSPWARGFLLAEASGTFRRGVTVAEATVELKGLLSQAAGPIAALGALCARMSRAHASLHP